MSDDVPRWRKTLARLLIRVAAWWHDLRGRPNIEADLHLVDIVCVCGAKAAGVVVGEPFRCGVCSHLYPAESWTLKRRSCCAPPEDPND